MKFLYEVVNPTTDEIVFEGEVDASAADEAYEAVLRLHPPAECDWPDASVCTLAPDGKIEWWIYETSEDRAVSPCQWQLGRLPQCRAQATDSRDGVRLCKGHAELFDRVVLAVHVYGLEMVELWQDGKFTGTFIRRSQ